LPDGARAFKLQHRLAARRPAARRPARARATRGAAARERAAPMSASAAPPFVSALSLLSAPAFLPLGDASLDALFGGRGLPLRGLVEIAGEAGSGKTALAMVVALRAAAARGGDALILNTEGPFPAARLLELAAGVAAAEGGGAARAAELAARVRIADVADAPALEAALEALAARCARGGGGAPPAAVVVDSIAAPLRAEMGGAADAPERARFLLAAAAALLRINAEAGAAAVAVNQVADVVAEDGGGGGGGAALAAAAAAGARCVPRRAAVWSGGRWVRPALGPAWDAATTHRIVLARGPGGARAAALVRSPDAPPAIVAFEITGGAVAGVGAPERVVEGAEGGARERERAA